MQTHFCESNSDHHSLYFIMRNYPFFSVLLLAAHLCVAAPMPMPESNDGAKHVFTTNQENS